MEEQIYLIEECILDQMENSPHLAVTYKVIGYKTYLTDAERFCEENQQIYTQRDCWAVYGSVKRFRVSEPIGHLYRAEMSNKI